MPKAKKNQKIPHESPTSTNPVPATGTLPPGWEKVHLSDVCKKKTQKVLPALCPDMPFIGMDCIRPHEMFPHKTLLFGDLKSSGNYFSKGDVLYGRMRPYLNKVYSSKFSGACSGEFIVLSCDAYPDFIAYLLHGESFVKFANGKTSGDRPRISYEEISSFEFFLPPLDEQERIVAKIEELFSDLDRGVEALKTAREQLKVYRQSILQSAFSGKLTSTKESSEIPHESPTSTNPVPAMGTLPPGWQWKRLGEIDVCAEITAGGAAPQGDLFFTGGKYPFVRVIDMGQVKGKKYLEKTRDKLNESGISKLRKFPKGTVLFTKSGASLLLNQRAIIESPMYVVSHIGCLIPGVSVVSDWLYWWMMQVDFAKYAHATTLPSLKLSTLSGIYIPLPPLDEQERIVAEIESRFSACDKLEESINLALSQSATLRQSILARAFSGNLL